jgi:hypothetical protein
VRIEEGGGKVVGVINCCRRRVGLLFADLGVVLRELEEGFKGLWIPDQRCSIRQTVTPAR